jgi:hypothetical protein|tara:strand:+ start:231 stop:674 length:444 start_codon:yes stop_codon:yes gene_type:complete
MTQRPSRFELVSKFFPELKEAIGSDRESLKKYSTLSCEVILADQIGEFDKGFLKHGPGVLAVRIHDGAKSCNFMPLQALEEDRVEAEKAGDIGIARFMTDIISKLYHFNFEQNVLLMLVDNSSARLFPIDREYPAKTIQALIEEFAA